jgi:hypothetical protein
MKDCRDTLVALMPSLQINCVAAVSVLLQVGLIEPSGGSAIIGGYDITKEMDDIYRLMGVCPQHDLLWETLTGRPAPAAVILCSLLCSTVSGLRYTSTPHP